MVGGFNCTRNSLVGLNLFYITVGILLISVGAHWMTSNRVSSLPIIGGVVACGVFLLAVAIFGIYAACVQHQIFLFFYMVILFCLFIIQFSIATACLSVSKETQEGIANQGWSSLEYSVKDSVQHAYHCCGFRKDGEDLGFLNQTDPRAHPSCIEIKECNTCDSPVPVKIGEGCCSEKKTCTCNACIVEVENVIAKAFRVTGIISLVFSFTEFIGIYLTVRYRNLRNPSLAGNPSAFL